MPRHKLTLAYDGTEFHGWQKQTGLDGRPLRTVQGVLELAVRRVVREPVLVVGASRTDAGVHAVGQVAAFTTTGPGQVPLERMPLAINSELPGDVQVMRAETVRDEFDPISDASSKGYAYRIVHGRSHPDRPDSDTRDTRIMVFDRRRVHRCYHALDARAMSVAAAHLVGEHDFIGFAHAAHGRESTVRRVLRCDVIEERDDELRIEVAGTGFLYNMVRIIAGTLVEVGRGRIAADTMPDVIASRDRRRAGQTLTPEGLCLMWVRYEA